MRILVGWDNAAEAESIDLFLNVGEATAEITTDAAEFENKGSKNPPDVILMSLDFPNSADSFAIFERIHAAQPDVPIVGAWRQGEIHQVAKFISHGLHSYVVRDDNGDYMLLLTSILEAAHASVLARRSEYLAQKLREEVESVRELQESVISKDLPQLEGYRVTARYEPSQIRVVGGSPVVMAGGDYYDIFSLGDDTLILVVGDAAGHGVKACMSIMTMHTLITMIRDKRYPNTVEFVQEVNRRLCNSEVVGGDIGGFITLLYCTLDAKNHRLQWTSAGHPMPLLQNMKTNEVVRLGSEEKGGLPLAVTDDWEYEMCEAQIPNHSRLILYTDGLDEAFPIDGDQKHDQFGEKGIIATVQATVNEPIEAALERLFVDSHAATKGGGRHDDTTAVIVERSSPD